MVSLLELIHTPYFDQVAESTKIKMKPGQGSHRNSKTQFHDFSMIFHDQQCNFYDYLSVAK